MANNKINYYSWKEKSKKIILQEKFSVKVKLDLIKNLNIYLYTNLALIFPFA